MASDRTAVLPLVIADLHARIAQGIATYGEPLMVENGRDHLQDLYEELLDSCLYLRAYRAQQPAFALGSAVQYKPYHPGTLCDGEGWDPRCWQIVGVMSTHLLGMARPCFTYALLPQGAKAGHPMADRPVVPVDEAQLRAWRAPAQPEEAPDGA